jgi:hypothetical protein
VDRVVASFLPLSSEAALQTCRRRSARLRVRAQSESKRNMKRERESRREQEYQVAATSTPPARLWAASAAEAVAQYVRTFNPKPGSNVILSPVNNQAQAELFAVTRHGPRRLLSGGER